MQVAKARILIDDVMQANVGKILRVGFLWAVELPRSVLNVVEYASNWILAAHDTFGCEYPCVR